MDEQNLNPQEPERELPVFDAPAVNTPDPDEIDVTKPIVPKRERKPNPRQVFKEERLPFIILGVAALLIVSFIFGSVSRGIAKSRRDAENARIAELLSMEAEGLKAQAALLAAEYDYEGAMDVLAGYSAGLASDPVLKDLYDQYKAAQEDLVVWDDFSQIPNLSFRTLVADLGKASADPNRAAGTAAAISPPTNSPGSWSSSTPMAMCWSACMTLPSPAPLRTAPSPCPAAPSGFPRGRSPSS